MSKEQAVKLLKIIDRVGMTIITLSISFGASEIKKMSENIATMNTNLAVVVTKNENQNKEISDLKERLVYLERIVLRKKDL